jgi:ribosome maturation factor RimP
LDEKELIAGSFMLEVSSPGIERKLATRAHFERAIGERVSLTLAEPADAGPKVDGKLVAIEGNQIDVAVDGHTVRIDLGQIRKARTVF